MSARDEGTVLPERRNRRSTQLTLKQFTTNLAAVFERAQGGETFVVHSFGKPVCRITPYVKRRLKPGEVRARAVQTSVVRTDTSHIMRRAQEGEYITIIKYDRPIALMTPYETS